MLIYEDVSFFAFVGIFLDSLSFNNIAFLVAFILIGLYNFHFCNNKKAPHCGAFLLLAFD